MAKYFSLKTIHAVYERLIHHSGSRIPSQCYVADSLHISRSAVCQITNALKHGGYITCADENACPKSYFPTKKPLNINKPSDLFASNRSKSTSPLAPRKHSLATSDDVFFSKSQFRADFMNRYFDTTGWTKTNGLKGEERWKKQILLDGIGTVTFHRRKTKNKHWLTFYIPPFTFSSKEWEQGYDYSIEMARRALNWIMKDRKTQLTNLRCERKAEIGFPVTNKQLTEEAHKAQFSGELMMDGSNDMLMVESDNRPLIHRLAEAPDRIDMLEKIAVKHDNQINKMAGIGEKQQTFIAKNTEMITKLYEMIGKPLEKMKQNQEQTYECNREDEFMDVV